MHQAVLKINFLLICACGSLKKKVNILHFSEKAFLNGHKHVNNMHVHVIIRERMKRCVKNVIYSQAGGC